MPDDLQWMTRALELAQRSVGLSSPNPAVGCVLVQGDGSLVGEGVHEYDKLDHAEIAALKGAGEKARGATAYVTLEPCSHQGRTGPCADALIAAQVSRVVVATGDPNPAVNGQGLAKLRAAGISVTTDMLRDQARALNDGFAKHIRNGLPFVTLKAGLSLDGRIAPASVPAGQTHYITSEASRTIVQRMRHASDAVITGVDTVIADDPLLTDRSGLRRRRPLLRVVLDSSLRLPVGSKLVKSAQGDVVAFHASANSDRVWALEDAGIRLERIEAVDGHVSLPAVMKRLGERPVLNAMLEAGPRLNSSALVSGVVDKLCLFYAPCFLGADAVPLLAGGRIAAPIERISWKTVGDDVCLEGYLRDPWA
ncbi:bifunctional diaminohydroxyphosphoribosylaminopyrimidine deaminase/5-amino-6-(5-phosphoribosylamino)uracil reductase RibD [Alloacidobacterium sp.]|uniref:bifunctional diaminohydroxyphosphoribosylaminopyrimidine deaminase/5-amino-6-(5-phosphoribosylamino)uracil reductase RibD n=1 Tax=Alloacidobacterium sp. TaxID=2951999 RepID=UPI002D55E7FD|nr:bifunctional diaminohydroxyphosphoribosylaminopyrimidine deaminase/5-amino-6-(5-phosphoribosylamino)uracil reductase RibD [Alloacidobacterium sp.]HYK36845.1 bifunctional diaminohydroxyphosphoribosylaminopyrimidine deaminase/5-amino-6-(5-phosphoribosylamino)uracil reductase RibD [Alloacidobacterium sp.]